MNGSLPLPSLLLFLPLIEGETCMLECMSVHVHKKGCVSSFQNILSTLSYLQIMNSYFLSIMAEESHVGGN